jgi:hypothetical protein
VRGLFLVLGCALAVGGCSIYPLQEDVTGFESHHVSRIFRCQAREGFMAQIERALTSQDWADRIIYDGMTGQQTADWLRANPENYRQLKIARLIKPAAALYSFYADTTISFDFTVDSSESNSAGLDVSLLKKFSSGSSTIGIKAGNDRTRQVKRQFRTYDTFDSLVRKLPVKGCDGIPDTQNAIYPAIGATRIASLITTFTNLNQHENLGAKDNPLDAAMSDTIVFNTKWTGNINPTISADAVPGRFVPSQIRLSSDNYRQDIYTVIALVMLPKDRDKIVQFDARGNIVSIGRSVIDDKFQEIRDNNYKEDVSKLTTGVIKLTQ